jgi:hypothetical protein
MEKACHGMAQYQRNLKDMKKHVNLKQKMKKTRTKHKAGHKENRIDSPQQRKRINTTYHVDFTTSEGGSHHIRCGTPGSGDDGREQEWLMGSMITCDEIYPDRQTRVARAAGNLFCHLHGPTSCVVFIFIPLIVL